MKMKKNTIGPKDKKSRDALKLLNLEKKISTAIESLPIEHYFMNTLMDYNDHLNILLELLETYEPDAQLSTYDSTFDKEDGEDGLLIEEVKETIEFNTKWLTKLEDGIDEGD